MSGPGALFLAFGAGLLSFVLPCTLPLIPGYLSYISGLGIDEVQDRRNRGTVLGAAALFVSGFSLVFVALGATASYIGSFLLPYRALLVRSAGVFIIIMALVTMGLFRLPLFYREKRFQINRTVGLWSALPLGMAFGLGWTPCVGPVLTSILALATTQGKEQEGALLLFVYSLGLGVPFLAVALFAGKMFSALKRFRRYYLALNLGGGAILLVMGFFLVLNRWTELMAPMLRWYADHPLPI